MACANSNICNGDTQEVCTCTMNTMAQLRVPQPMYDHNSPIARAAYQCCTSAGATQNPCVHEDRWTLNRRLTLPSISHRGPELLDTHASIFCLWGHLSVHHQFSRAQVHTPAHGCFFRLHTSIFLRLLHSPKQLKAVMSCNTPDLIMLGAKPFFLDAVSEWSGWTCMR